ncbi:PP2C family protein-serine/threonine phosphatase [Cryobacterium aureum]|uniref:PP2C family protein-serine/threonine phosphatase n=1 Tax=Cryobacterium aureum TaxID=995037 RepID=UPI001F0C983D|nr:SpoIIE family protein phosphatase [Cryobacterium aureum]
MTAALSSMPPTLQHSELTRQRALDDLQILDTAPEERFDRITRLVKELFHVEIAIISLIDHDRQWNKSSAGIEPDQPTEYPRSNAFCDSTIDACGTLIVADARLDPRFRDNIYVTGAPGIRFYAGHALEAHGGERIGALCVFGTEPREFTELEQNLLRDLAFWVQKELNASQELDQAAAVQRGLLPKKLVSLPGFEVAGACSPARAVGGDFYDWYPVGEGAAFTLADVMGKGVGAAIIAATVRAVLRAGSRLDAVADVALAAAATLEPDLDEANSFVTLFHARLDMDTGVIRYVDAGHGLSLVVHANGTTERLTSLRLPVGAGDDSPWEEQRVVLAPGSTLISVSDGVLDLFDGTLASLAAVDRLVRQASTAQAVVDSLMSLAGLSAPDDVTVIVVRREMEG